MEFRPENRSAVLIRRNISSRVCETMRATAGVTNTRTRVQCSQSTSQTRARAATSGERTDNCATVRTSRSVCPRDDQYPDGGPGWCPRHRIDQLIPERSRVSAGPMIRDFQQTTVASIGLLAQANTVLWRSSQLRRRASSAIAMFPGLSHSSLAYY